jgi:ketosteroid isomerase-like protein
MAQENVELVRGAYEAFSRGDLPALLDALHPGIEWDAREALLHKGLYVGHEGVKEYVGRMADVWEDFQLEPQEARDVGQGLVLVQGRIAGRDKSTGQAMEARFTHLAHIVGNKVVKLQILLDPSQALEVADEAATKSG